MRIVTSWLHRSLAVAVEWMWLAVGLVPEQVNTTADIKHAFVCGETLGSSNTQQLRQRNKVGEGRKKSFIKYQLEFEDALKLVDKVQPLSLATH